MCGLSADRRADVLRVRADGTGMYTSLIDAIDGCLTAISNRDERCLSHSINSFRSCL